MSYEGDYITEEEALKRPPCRDPKQPADVKMSRLSIHGRNKAVYRLGEVVHVAIHLYDVYGKPLKHGGAVLRARMFNLEHSAYATAYVTDHGNGTYTAMFKALWTGNGTIKVQIAYTQETIRAIYYTRQKLNGALEIYGEFSVNKIKETTLCHSLPGILKNGTNVKICNLTGDNSGMPWYCIKPVNIHLLCEDWTGITIRQPKLPLTSCEAAVLKRSRLNIDQSIQIKIEGEGAIIPLPSNSCKKFNVSALWTSKQPTGFMYNNSWHLLHCNGHMNKKDKMTCLQNKTVLLFGDSTVRQWYVYISRTFACNLVTETWTISKWHKRAACENKAYNFTVLWLPHSQPMRWLGDKRYSTTSISRHLDEIGRDDHVVAVIHLYAHVLPYHHSVFKTKIRKIRESIDKLLARNKYVRILIKGPHTFDGSNGIYMDFYAPVYKRIMYEEFHGLHDIIIFLDNKDISVARNNYDIHPPDVVVGAMVNQILSYI